MLRERLLKQLMAFDIKYLIYILLCVTIQKALRRATRLTAERKQIIKPFNADETRDVFVKQKKTCFCETQSVSAVVPGRLLKLPMTERWHWVALRRAPRAPDPPNWF